MYLQYLHSFHQQTGLVSSHWERNRETEIIEFLTVFKLIWLHKHSKSPVALTTVSKHLQKQLLLYFLIWKVF